MHGVFSKIVLGEISGAIFKEICARSPGEISYWITRWFFLRIAGRMSDVIHEKVNK